MKLKVAIVVLSLFSNNLYAQIDSKLSACYKQSVYHLNKTHKYDSAELFCPKRY
jgi:hypothetical protein